MTLTVDQTTIILQVISGAAICLLYSKCIILRMPTTNVAYFDLYILEIQIATRAVKIMKCGRGKPSNTLKIYRYTDLPIYQPDICKGREPGYYPDLFNCAK